MTPTRCQEDIIEKGKKKKQPLCHYQWLTCQLIILNAPQAPNEISNVNYLELYICEIHFLHSLGFFNSSINIRVKIPFYSFLSLSLIR